MTNKKNNSENNAEKAPDRMFPYSPVINAVASIAQLIGSRQIMEESELKDLLQRWDYLLTDELFEESMQICDNTSILTARTADGWCYQTNTRKTTPNEMGEVMELLSKPMTNQV